MLRLLLLFHTTVAVYIACWFIQQLPTGQGQGLELPAAEFNLGAAGVEYKKLEARYKRVQGIKATYKDFSRQQQAQTTTRCTAAEGFLCAANSADKDSKQVLLMAASPDVFDSRSDSFQTNPVSPPGDQGECNSCVGFAVAAAAEAAVASTLQIKGSDVALSVQDLQYCEMDEKGNVELARLCRSSWNILRALLRLQQRPPVHQSCLQYRAPDIEENTLCSYCPQKQYDQYASQGSFTFMSVQDFADVQQAIRDSGGVVTAMTVNIQHMRDFFTANPKGIYRGSPANMSTEGHAVFVIGYSNPGSFWLVKNSFGTGFADGGFMRVAYGTSGIMPPQDQTFKVIFTPRKPQQSRQLCVTDYPQRKGCFLYTAQAKDYMGRVAKAVGVPLAKFLLDNTENVRDLDKPLTGLQLLVCDPDGYRINNACSIAASNAASKQALAAGTESVDAYAQLMMATSPQVYSSNNPQQVGKVPLVAAAGDQTPCKTCTAFAVVAAAETAMAAVLRVPVQDCSISVQALYFCPPSGPTRSCDAGWNLPEALSQLEQRGSSLPTADCLQYKPDYKSEMTRAQLCEGGCSYPNDYADEGGFTSAQITSAWAAQRHIRQYGAVVTRFDVYSDFLSFFKDFANSNSVYKPGPGATMQFGHAVVLVGYNNDEEYWIAKNSYGPDWGDGGLFKVAFGVCSVLTGSAEAYGIIWTPNQPVAATQLPVTSAAPQRPGCYWYKAGPLDYLSRVAWLASITLDQFMLDNTAIVKDLDAPLKGLQLLLCKPKPGAVRVLPPTMV